MLDVRPSVSAETAAAAQWPSAYVLSYEKIATDGGVSSSTKSAISSPSTIPTKDGVAVTLHKCHVSLDDSWSFWSLAPRRALTEGLWFKARRM